MNDNQDKRTVPLGRTKLAQILKCHSSLEKAVADAGGQLSDRYLAMSVEVFLMEIAAPNNIQFAYKGPE